MTEKEIKAYHDKVDQNIRTIGYHMTFVFDKKLPCYCYSTGIYKSFGIPEIFISSLPENLSYHLIKSYVEMFQAGKSIPLNVKIDNLSDRFAVYLIEAQKSQLTDYVLSTIRFYKDEKYKYLQLIYPDTLGRFPDHPDYNYDQEIMGNFK